MKEHLQDQEKSTSLCKYENEKNNAIKTPLGTYSSKKCSDVSIT